MSCLSCISLMLKSTQLSHPKAFVKSRLSKEGNLNLKSESGFQISVNHKSQKLPQHRVGWLVGRLDGPGSSQLRVIYIPPPPFQSFFNAH